MQYACVCVCVCVGGGTNRMYCCHRNVCTYTRAYCVRPITLLQVAVPMLDIQLREEKMGPEWKHLHDTLRTSPNGGG